MNISSSDWLHLTGTHVTSQTGRLYKFQGAFDSLTSAELALFDAKFTRALTSQELALHVPSVSTVLTAIVTKDWLKHWRQKVGEDEANRVRSTAVARGTSMHAAIEQFLTRSATDGEVKELVGAGDAADNELLHSMSGVVNDIASSNSRLQPYVFYSTKHGAIAFAHCATL